VSVYCNGCRGFVAGPIGRVSAGLAFRLGRLVCADSDEGCLIRRRANAMKDSSVTSVRSFDTRIIFRDPKVSVSSRNTKAEAAAKAANHSRAKEKARKSCEETAAARGTRVVMNAPCLVICEVKVSVYASSQGVIVKGRSASQSGAEQFSCCSSECSKERLHIPSTADTST